VYKAKIGVNSTASIVHFRSFGYLAHNAMLKKVNNNFPAYVEYGLFKMVLLLFIVQVVNKFMWVKREKKTLRKLRGPWLFNNPASDPSTTKGTSSEVVNSFLPDHSRASTHLELPTHCQEKVHQFIHCKVIINMNI